MKTAIAIAALILSGCATHHWKTQEERDARWNDMWTDIALRHKYESYLRHHPYCPLNGYTKE